MTDPHTDTEPEVDETTEGTDLDVYETADGYDFDAAYSEVVKPPFRFRWAGSWWQLPHLVELDWRTIRKFNDLATVGDETQDIDAVADRVAEVLRDAFGERAEEFDNTPQPSGKLIMLFNRWKDHCGVDVGEASSSNGSSGSTAGPSKRTSRSGASTSARRSSAVRKSGTRRASS